MAGPSLVGERVRLRPMRRSDGRALGEILRDRQVARFLPPRVRQETGEQFVRRVLREQAHGEGVAFVLSPIVSEEVVGQIRFVAWSRADRRGEVGYWLRRRWWGKGLGTDALRLICRYGFRSMSLHRIEARVVAGNLRSRRSLERVGFRIEGQARHAAPTPKGWVDVWEFGLLRSDFRAGAGGTRNASFRRRGGARS
ncbi:MAG: GNAT family N-acetyltransferase [Thermoplasmata archaeon]|nr:GNAT family N-acetyltransferase [Thermoplasmata archaeon]